jgi:DNA-binding transcriptional LysR family regulator
MDDEQLLTFITVQEYNNYSRAAEELNLTQPAVTARIQKLEMELDCKLIYRDGKKILLTDEGKALLPFARRIINYMTEAKQTIGQFKTPTITIGLSPGISISIIMELLTSLKEKKGFSFDLFEAQDSYEISQLIYEGRVDIGIVRDIIPFSDLQPTHFFIEQMLFVVGKNHPLAAKQEIKYSDLVGQTMVCYRRNTPIAIKIEEKLVGIENLHRIEVGSFEMVKSMVQNNWGFCIIPELALGTDHKMIEKNFVVIPFPEFDSLNFNVTAIYKKDSPKLESLQSILSIIEAKIKRLWVKKSSFK